MMTIDVTSLLSTTPDSNSWINADQIIGYLQVLTRNSQQWTYLESRLTDVQMAKKSILKRINNQKNVLFPLCYDKHWTLLVIQDESIGHFDPYHRSTTHVKVHDLAKALNWELKILKDQMPRQDVRDHINCGVFVMKAAWNLVHGDNWDICTSWRLIRIDLVKQLMTMHKCKMGARVLKEKDLDAMVDNDNDDSDNNEVFDVVGLDDEVEELQRQDEIREFVGQILKKEKIQKARKQKKIQKKKLQKSQKNQKQPTPSALYLQKIREAEMTHGWPLKGPVFPGDWDLPKKELRTGFGW